MDPAEQFEKVASRKRHWITLLKDGAGQSEGQAALHAIHSGSRHLAPGEKRVFFLN
jgi:hypothetical protein